MQLSLLGLTTVCLAVTPCLAQISPPANVLVTDIESITTLSDQAVRIAAGLATPNFGGNATMLIDPLVNFINEMCSYAQPDANSLPGFPSSNEYNADSNPSSYSQGDQNQICDALSSLLQSCEQLLQNIDTNLPKSGDSPEEAAPLKTALESMQTDVGGFVLRAILTVDVCRTVELERLNGFSTNFDRVIVDAFQLQN